MIKKAILLLTVAAAAFGFEFAKDGRGACVIAESAKPSKFEKMAAADLKHFLGEITGADIPVVAEGQAKGNVIYVGRTAFAASCGIAFDAFGKEEWLVCEKDHALIVTGGRPIGTFYGVWRLLNQLGCYPLTMEQTRLKKAATLNTAIWTERKQPCFAGRNIYDGFPVTSTMMGIPEKDKNDYKMWLLRSFINGKQHNRIIPFYIGDMMRISTNPQWHTLCLYVPDSLFETHPEYFTMDETGKRVKPRTSQAGGSVCMSNPAVQALALENLRKIVQRDRSKIPQEDWPVLYDVTLLDNFPIICLCPNCKAVIEEEGAPIGLLMRFVNYMAENIAKEYPDICIRTSAYGAAGGIGTTIKTKPARNVYLEVADNFVECDCFHPLSHEFSAKARAKFEFCHSLGCKLSVWDYWNLYFEPPRIETLTHAIQPDIRYFRELGVHALFLEAERSTYKPQNFIDMNYFIAARLMIDPDEDVNALIDLFMDAYYGQAAPDIRGFYDRLSSSCSNYTVLQKGMRTALWDFITPEYVAETYTLLKNAAAKNPAGSLERRHVTDEMLPLLWITISKFYRYKKAFAAIGVELKTLQQECHDYAMAHMMRFHPQTPEFQTPYAKTMLDFKTDFDKVTNKPLPVPEKFKDVPDERIRVFGKNSFEQKHQHHAIIVADKDSFYGGALCSSSPNPAHHGVGTVVRDPHGKWSFQMTEFGYNDKPGIIIKDIPQDEKYHWYKMPGIRIVDGGHFYGHNWYIDMVLSSVFQPDDGVSDENVWDIWFSCKFTGPAYVKDSKQKNAVWADSVILVKPDAEKYVKP